MIKRRENCIYCNKKLTEGNAKRKFCSDKCKVYYRRELIRGTLEKEEPNKPEPVLLPPQTMEAPPLATLNVNPDNSGMIKLKGNYPVVGNKVQVKIGQPTRRNILAEMEEADKIIPDDKINLKK